MKPQPFIVPPDSYPEPLNVLGVDISVLASNQATQGYEITLQQGGPGIGPPPHSHAWDESFFVLRGSVHILCQDRSFDCPIGTLAHVPGGVVHGYAFGAKGGAMLEISSAGGLATRMFTNVSRNVAAQAPDMPRLMELLSRNGVTVVA